MFKLFWVWKEEEQFDDEELDVEVIDSDEVDEKPDIGQVALDVLDWEDYIYVIAPIAWVVYEDIDLSINKTVLTIKWTRQKPEEYFLDSIKVRNEECFWGKFSRNIILPENLDFDRIRAYMQNNLLVVSLPKLKYNVKSVRINKVES